MHKIQTHLIMFCILLVKLAQLETSDTCNLEIDPSPNCNVRNLQIIPGVIWKSCNCHYGCTGYPVVSCSGWISGHFSLFGSSFGSSSWQSKNWIMKPDNFTYLLASVDSFAAPWIQTRTPQAQTCNLWLHPHSSLGVQVKLVLSPNCWVLTQTM